MARRADMDLACPSNEGETVMVVTGIPTPAARGARRHAREPRDGGSSPGAAPTGSAAVDG